MNQAQDKRSDTPCFGALLLAAMTFLFLVLYAAGAIGQEETGEAGEAGQGTRLPSGDDYMPEEYTRSGADQCLRCHNEQDWPHVADILNGPHGAQTDPRAPFGPGQLQCEACHGPGGDHAGRIRGDDVRPPMPAFAPNSPWSEEKQNQQCLNCHQGTDHRFWAGGTHQRNEVGCADCHQSHSVRDPVTVASTETEICSSCHLQQRAEIHRAYTHPVRYGEMSCTSCHQPHGSVNEAMLAENTINDNCYECHAEYRGPYLWEHAPVVENCTNCHKPHGSNNPGMLTRRAPLLCQSCHSRQGHPSIGLTGDDLEGSLQSAFLLSGSCTSCHSQVHGSNHPSGAILNR